MRHNERHTSMEKMKFPFLLMKTKKKCNKNKTASKTRFHSNEIDHMLWV